MEHSFSRENLLKIHVALPQDHGSWVFLFSPMLIGIFAGQNWTGATFFLVLSAVAAFLIRQPVTVLIKALSGRRSSRDLPSAYFWSGLYSLFGLLGVLGLIWLGYAYILLLALPGLPVFAWHLTLVSRRAERRQIGVEIVGVGVLALAAPAAYWVGVGFPAYTGIGLWLLVWLQSAASIVYAYARLEQRVLKSLPDLPARLRMSRRARLYTTFNLVLVIGLALTGYVPVLLIAPYGLQWLETLYGSLIKPAVGLKPTRIGIRQLIVSSLFTLLFILGWLSPLQGRIP
jgi:hypothetical protein